MALPLETKAQASPAALACSKDRDGPFGGDERLVVAGDDQARAQPPAGARRVAAGVTAWMGASAAVVAQGLAGDPVLAVGAMKIAAHHAERQRIAAGIDVEERLLLDRVALHAGDVAERHAQLAAFVEAHLANAAMPRADETAMAAGDATNALALGPPQRTDGRVAVQNIGQRYARRAGLRG